MISRPTPPVRLYTAYACGQVGLWILRAILLYDAFVSGDARALALVVFALFLPLAIGGQFFAPLFARAPHRSVMGSVETLRIVLIGALAFSDAATREMLAPVVVFVLGIAQPVFASAQVAYLRAITDDERLPYGLGMLANIERATNILGLVGGALVLAALSVPQALALSMLFVVASATVIAILLAPSRSPSSLGPSPQNMVPQVDTTLLFASVFLLNSGAGVINLFQVIVALDTYQAGPAGLATMFLIVGSFGLAGAFVSGRAVSALRPPRAATFAAAGVAVSLTGMSSNLGLLWSAVAGGMMLGFGQVFAVAAHTMIVTSYPPTDSARGSARFQALTFAGIAANALVFAALARVVPFSSYVLACSIAATLSALALYRYWGRTPETSLATPKHSRGADRNV